MIHRAVYVTDIDGTGVEIVDSGQPAGYRVTAIAGRRHVVMYTDACAANIVRAGIAFIRTGCSVQQRIRRTGIQYAVTNFLRIAIHVRRSAADGSQGNLDVGWAGIADAVTELVHVANVDRRTTERGRRFLHIRRTGVIQPVTEVSRIAQIDLRATKRGRRFLHIRRTGVIDAVTEITHVANVG